MEMDFCVVFCDRRLDHAWFTSNKLLLIYNIIFYNEVETKDLRTVRCSSSCSTSNEGLLFCGFEVCRLLAYQVVCIGLDWRFTIRQLVIFGNLIRNCLTRIQSDPSLSKRSDSIRKNCTSMSNFLFTDSRL